MMKSCCVKLRNCCRESFRLIMAVRPVGMHNVKRLWNSRQVFMNQDRLNDTSNPPPLPTSSSRYILFEQFSLWVSFGALLIYSLASGSGSAGCKINVTSPKFWSGVLCWKPVSFPQRDIWIFQPGFDRNDMAPTAYFWQVFCKVRPERRWRLGGKYAALWIQMN